MCELFWHNFQMKEVVTEHAQNPGQGLSSAGHIIRDLQVAFKWHRSDL